MNRWLVAFLWLAKAWPPPFPDPSLPPWTLSNTCFPVPRANESTVLMARNFSKKLPGSRVVGSHRLPD